MDEKDGVKTFYAASRSAWRQWLKKNHAKEKSLWLIIYHKKSKTPSVYYDEAVEEALCFGWIDSKPNKRDDESFYLFFAKRNPKSKWSALNKKRVEKLLKAGFIEKAGLDMIELAKQNGTWTALDAVENLEMPEGLKQAFSKNKKALKNFEAFPPSAKKGIYQWIRDAKREDTQAKRTTETVTLAAQNIRANQWRK
jgi:uncharacterized protein YdeI (YjbR/CyaY-like superfamily)